MPGGHSSPVLTPTHIFMTGIDGDKLVVFALERASGKELWRLSDDNTQVKVPTPILAGDVIVVTGGYPPGGRPIYGIKPGASGELNAQALAWKTERGAP